MKKFFLIFLFFPFFCYAETSLKEILNQPDLFNGQVIEIKGEVIGEILKTKEGNWLNILTSEGNIGVFIPPHINLTTINYFGSYKYHGDILQIKGIFYKNCPLHQEADLHLLGFRVVQKGFLKEEKLELTKIKLLFISLIICLTTIFIYFIKYKLIWKKK